MRRGNLDFHEIMLNVNRVRMKVSSYRKFIAIYRKVVKKKQLTLDNFKKMIFARFIGTRSYGA